MSKLTDTTDEDFKKIVLESVSYRQIALKLGYSDSGGILKKNIQKRMEELNITDKHFLKHSGGGNKVPDEQVFCKDSKVGQSTVRRRYFSLNKTEYKCSICGLLPFWNGKELVLTLDHIDGNHHNNTISNLRWVCPNCDRQLPTFGGRNNK